MVQGQVYWWGWAQSEWREDDRKFTCFAYLTYLWFCFFTSPLAGGMNAAKTIQMRAIPAGRLVLFLNPGSLAWGFCFWRRSPFLALVLLGKVNSNLYTRTLSILVYSNDQCWCKKCHSQGRKSATHFRPFVFGSLFETCKPFHDVFSAQHQMDLAHVAPAKLCAREVEGRILNGGLCPSNFISPSH